MKNKDLERLKFRRQFLLGPGKYSPNKYWNHHKLNHKLYLSIHEDLNFWSKKQGGSKIILIGVAIDCTAPDKTSEEVVATLLNSFNDVYSIIEATKPLSGRWILICQDTNNTFIFADPCGQREVYFSKKKDFWCASQPTLINQVERLSKTSNESIHKFRNSTKYKKRQSFWIGNKTIFDDCYHLMPNHYLDFRKQSQGRFFPLDPIAKSTDISRLVIKASQYFKNIMRGLDKRFNLQMGLSAGYDSRILLSATKDIYKNILFTTHTVGWLKGYDGDIYVPKALAKKHKLNHEISDIDKTVPSWFTTILENNILQARTSPLLPKVKAIYNEIVDQRSDYISVGGNVTEIVRPNEQIRIPEQKSTYEIDGEDATTIELLIKYAGYNNQYVRDEIAMWFDSIDPSLLQEATTLDLFYWEQRMGNWGALHPAERDLAVDSICPFNCRLLLETCLTVPREQRIAPDYNFFLRIIENNWPELLSEPFNPGPKGIGLLKATLKETLPPTLLNQLRKLIR